MKNADIFLLVSVRQAMDAVHRAFGAPGDHGYGTAEGAALFELYKQRAAVADALAEAGWKEGDGSTEAVSPYNPAPKGVAERKIKLSLPAETLMSLNQLVVSPRRSVRR